VSTEKVAHAYLFSGPRGVGKTTVARILSKAVNCEDKKDGIEPCNKCSSCEEITSSRSIDVIEIDAASHTGVDNVRENIIENAQFRPTKSKYKIFIIDEVHMLSTSAFNALLKTLEEPPEHVLFILATTEMHKLPATIISRCQRFNFKKISFDTMAKHLSRVAKAEEVKIDKEVVERIVNKSDGCARDAVSLLDQIMATGEKQITAEIASLVLPTTNVEKTLSFVSFLVKKDGKAGLESIDSLVEEGINLIQFNHDTIELLRVMMVSQASSKSEIAGTDLSNEVKKELKSLNNSISQSEIVQLIDIFMRRGQEIRISPLPQLPLEMGVIEWCAVKEEGAVEEVKEEIEEKVEEKVEDKKTITKRVKQLVTKKVSFELKEVEDKWNDFVGKIEASFPSLSFILKMADLLELNGNTLQIAVGFDFHRDKLMEKSYQRHLDKELSEIMGEKVKIEARVQEKAKESHTEEQKELQELASSLGGKVVN